MKQAFVDLDSIVAEDVAFRFKGTDYVLRPITAKAFMQYANAVAEMQKLFEAKTVTEKEVLDCYVGVISACCPDVTEELILDMNKLQISALLQMILDFTQGKIKSNEDVEDVKKKT
jgi:hypothetical protein